MQLTIDAALQERVEAVHGRGGPRPPPAGGHRVGDGPAQRRAAGAGQLAARGLQRHRRRARSTRARTAPWAPATSPDRPSRPSRWPGALEEGLIKPATEFDLPPQIQVADRKIGEAHDRGAVTPDRGRDPRPVLERGLGDDRPEAGPEAVRPAGCAGSASGGPPASGCPGEAGGIVPRPKDYSGSSLGNLPIGQGLAVTPMQMAAAYSAIANGGVMHAPARGRGRGRPAAGAWSRPATPARSRGCSRACWRPAARRRRRRCPATSWRARPAPPRSPTPSRRATRSSSSSPPSSASRPRASRGCWWR